MSKKDDIPELPLAPRRRGAIEKPGSTTVNAELVEPGNGLTAEQKGQLIQGSFQVAKDVADIARRVCDIWEIREQADADVARIDADHRRIVGILRATVGHVEARRREIQARGEVVVAIVQSMMPGIRASDLSESEKRSLIQALPGLVHEALNASVSEPEVGPILGSEGAKT